MRYTCLSKTESTIAIGETHKDISILFRFVVFEGSLDKGVLSAGCHVKYYKVEGKPNINHIQFVPLEDSFAPSCGSTLLLRKRTDFESKLSVLKRSVKTVW